MWSVWRVDGSDPYCLWNDLDREFRPLESAGGGESLPPPYPSRRLDVLFAFGNYEAEFLAKLQGGKKQRQRG